MESLSLSLRAECDNFPRKWSPFLLLANLLHVTKDWMNRHLDRYEQLFPINLKGDTGEILLLHNGVEEQSSVKVMMFLGVPFLSLSS